MRFENVMFDKRLKTLSRLSGLLAQSSRLEDILPTATKMVADVIGVEVVLVYSVDRNCKRLALLAHRGVSQEFVEGAGRLKRGEGFNGRVLVTGEPMLVVDAANDPRLSLDVVRQENLRSQLIVPMKARGQIVGTICVATHQMREFPPEEIELLTAISNEIGIAIANSLLYQRQQVMTEQLERYEANYRELFQNASDAIWIHDLEGNILEANEAVEIISGFSMEELLSRKVSDFLTPLALDIAKDVKGKLLGGEKIEGRYEQRVTRKDGTELIVEQATRLITDHEGNPIGFHNIARDVTDQRARQENLRIYVKGLLRAQEDERSRISRELHDDIAQSLLLLSRKLDAIVSNPPGKIGGPLREAITEAYDLNVKIYSNLQAYARSLRPDILDHLGLKSALEWLVEDLTRDNGIETNTEIHESACNLSPEIELVLFRITQEALNNVKKHAQATSVSVKLQCEGNNVTLTIADNGKGFEVPLRLSDKVTTGKLGLAGMEERARLIGGTLCIKSKVGKGTVVVAKLPQVMVSPISITK